MDQLEKIEGEIICPQDQYKKSNALVSAKYKSTLVENKLLALSLSRADEMKVEEVNIKGDTVRVFTSVMKSVDIEKALGITSKNLPAQLKAAYVKMQSRQIGMEDDRGQFIYRNLFIGADYINGEFKLYYNPLLSSYYQEISKNYTSYSLETMMNFKSVHSFRLYELLKKECYNSNRSAKIYKKPDLTRYIFNYDIAELKLMLGIVNAESPTVRNILDKEKKNPDFEKAVKNAPEKGFDRWSDMKRRCIDPAVEEINNNTEMFVSYDLKKSGQGGKVFAITFTVDVQADNTQTLGAEDVSEEKSLTNPDNLSFIDDVLDIIEEKIKIREAQLIAEAAGYDIEKIKKAYKIAKMSNNVENLVGFMISAIKNEYSENISITNSKNLAGSFGNFKQNDIDFEELKNRVRAN